MASYYGVVQWVGAITRGGAVRSHEYRSLRYRSSDYAAGWCRTQVERLQREGSDVKRARVVCSRKPVEYEDGALAVEGGAR